MLILANSARVCGQEDKFSFSVSQKEEWSFYLDGEYSKRQNTVLSLGIHEQLDSRMIGVEIFCFWDKLNLSSTSFISRADEVGFTSTVTFSESDISYAYLGVRFHRGYRIWQSAKSSFWLSPYFTAETNVFEKESNHSQYSRTRTQYTVDEVFFASDSTTSIAFDSFDAVEINKLFVSIGLNVSYIVDLPKFSIVPFYSYGINRKWHVFDNFGNRSSLTTSALRGIPQNDLPVGAQVHGFHELGLKVYLNKR